MMDHVLEPLSKIMFPCCGNTEAEKVRSIFSNSNWTEWSTIQGVIERVIQNRTSAKREADLKLRARLLPELYDTRSNY